jgi:transcriptional regulator with XRE-family HTH domain
VALKTSERQRFVDRLTEGMNQRGWGNVDLARELGVPMATLTHWFKVGEEGGGWPKAEYLIRLPVLLGVEERWLFRGEGPMDRTPAGTSAQTFQLKRVIDEMRIALNELEDRYVGKPNREGEGADRLARAKGARQRAVEAAEPLEHPKPRATPESKGRRKRPG